jgi:hypothetical protein
VGFFSFFSFFALSHDFTFEIRFHDSGTKREIQVLKELILTLPKGSSERGTLERTLAALGGAKSSASSTHSFGLSKRGRMLSKSSV